MKEKYKRISVGVLTIFLIIIMIVYIDYNVIIENLSKISFFGIFLFVLVYTSAFLLRTLRL